MGWESKNMFVLNKDKPPCLLSNEAVALPGIQFMAAHWSQAQSQACLANQVNKQKVYEFKGSLWSQRNSFVAVYKPKCFSEGAFSIFEAAYAECVWCTLERLPAIIVARVLLSERVINY